MGLQYIQKDLRLKMLFPLDFETLFRIKREGERKEERRREWKRREFRI